MTHFHERLIFFLRTLPSKAFRTHSILCVSILPWRTGYVHLLIHFSIKSRQSSITNTERMKDSFGIFLLMSLLQLIAFEWISAIWLWGQSNSKKDWITTLMLPLIIIMSILPLFLWYSFSFRLVLAKDVVPMRIMTIIKSV